VTEAAIADCTIRNNTDSGIYCSYVESISITDCNVENNTEGGIYLEDVDSLIIKGCNVEDNASSGIYLEDFDSLLIKGCKVTGNVGGDEGGGICVKANSAFNDMIVQIEDCIISSNLAGMDGGGIFCSIMHGNITIERSLISGNKSQMMGWGYGGGGYFDTDYGQVYLKDCVFSSNSAALGSGIFVYNCGNPFVDIGNCVFSGNMSRYGGLLDGQSFSGNITNCTIVGNYIENRISEYRFSNCIIWNNRGERGFIYVVNPIYNCIEGGHTALGNIDVDPCFVDPGYWDANGTPGDANDDYWVEGDYHLKSEGWRWDQSRRVWTWDDVTSLCIDAGNPGSALGDELLSVPDDPDNEWSENVRINRACP
jgi:parallel beta-helix repeat protein